MKNPPPLPAQIGKGSLPTSLEFKIRLSSEKAAGFRILKRVLKSANLSQKQADKVNRVLGAI